MLLHFVLVHHSGLCRAFLSCTSDFGGLQQLQERRHDVGLDFRGPGPGSGSRELRFRVCRLCLKPCLNDKNTHKMKLCFRISIRNAPYVSEMRKVRASEQAASWPKGNGNRMRPISLLRSSLLRFVDSTSLGNPPLT